MTIDPDKPMPSHNHSSDQSKQTALPHTAEAALSSSPVDKDSTMISLAEAEALAMEILDDYRKQMLSVVKRQLDLFGDEMQQAAKAQFETTQAAIEADLSYLRSSYRKSSGDNIIDYILWGICLTGFGGCVLGLLIIGAFKLFAVISEGG